MGFMASDLLRLPVHFLSGCLFLIFTLSIGIAAERHPEDIATEAACPSCNDFNFCTIDSCNPDTGTCRHLPANPCDDLNPCTIDSCVRTGTCSHQNLPTGTLCEDGNSCTTSDACNASHLCRGIPLPLGSGCDDLDSCTSDDTCRINGLCIGELRSPGDPCDDSTSCTSGETCVEEFGALLCRVPGTACDDGDPCTIDRCQEPTGECAHLPASCDDGNSCTVDGCDSASGGCIVTFAPGPCNDGNPCTTSDSCTAGNCLGGAPLNCDDAKICSNDFCFPETGGCVHFPNTTPGICGPPSSNPCFGTPFCNSSFNCQSPIHFGAPCEVHGCVQYTCSQTGACFDRTGQPAPTGYPCDDGNPCTNHDSCSGFSCIGQPACNDANVCTVDSCDANGACLFVPTSGSCNDSNPCTGNDSCSEGTCRGVPISGPCNDSNFCTENDSCSEGTCRGGSPRLCDDANACTDDSCNPSTGCLASNNTHPCDDGNICTTADACSGGACAGGPPPSCDDAVACTADSCDPALGCAHAPTDELCDEGNTCTLDFCNATLGCQHQDVGAGCTDENPCTADSCDPIEGCVFAPIPGSITCGIGACQRTGLCENGVPQACTPGLPVLETCNGVDDDCDGATDEDAALCDDGDSCTVDSCLGAGGCSHSGGGTPSIEVSLTPSLLTPANHGMVPINASVRTTGGCGGTLAVTLTSITSSEPDDAPGFGDGRTTGDIQEAAFGTADFNFQLRAERAGRGHGRAYTITYTGTATGGQTISGTASVLVPRDARPIEGLEGNRAKGKAGGRGGSAPASNDGE